MFLHEEIVHPGNLFAVQLIQYHDVQIPMELYAVG